MTNTNFIVCHYLLLWDGIGTCDTNDRIFLIQSQILLVCGSVVHACVCRQIVLDKR